MDAKKGAILAGELELRCRECLPVKCAICIVCHQNTTEENVEPSFYVQVCPSPTQETSKSQQDKPPIKQEDIKVGGIKQKSVHSEIKRSSTQVKKRVRNCKTNEKICPQNEVVGGADTPVKRGRGKTFSVHRHCLKCSGCHCGFKQDQLCFLQWKMDPNDTGKFSPLRSNKKTFSF